MNTIETVACTIAIMLLIVGPASSLTRTISYTNDNIYTLIRNSNGKYWEPTTANIQVAINDLGNSSGYVWLPGNKTFYLTKTVVVWKNITLDMGGCEFKLPYGTDINVVELKDGAGIKNGVIDVSGHQGDDKTGYDRFTTNTSFSVPHACIFLNASSYIHSAHIENMCLESISDGYQSVWQDPPIYYSNDYTGRGYGIYLYASNVSVPQLITNVKVSDIYTCNFYHAIFIHNERHPVGSENGAHIDGNTFEMLKSNADSYYINISRNTDVDRDKCSTSGNVFNLLQFQTGRGSWWGGDEITWRMITTDGYGNMFTNIMGWDSSYLHGDGNWIVFTSDSDHCYISGRCRLDGALINDGQNNTLFDYGWSELTVKTCITKE